MTPKQVELARHALGLDGKRATSYRNRFFAGSGHADYDDWIYMVGSGDAERTGLSYRRYFFYLTPQGAEKALRPGETLCAEDFPRTGDDA